MKEEKITHEDIVNMGRAIPHEVYLLYTLATACDAMVYDLERRMQGIDKALHLRQEPKMRMKQYLGLISKMESHFENFISPYVIDMGKDGNYADYEKARIYAQELLRLLMMYYEKCNKHDRHISVFKHIASFEEGRGVFTVEDINRFNLGCNEQGDA